MKLFWLLLLLVLVAYLWRNLRAGSPPAQPPAAPKPVAPMLTCARCGVHLPPEDAIPGRNGVYCSPAHRQQQEP